MSPLPDQPDILSPSTPSRFLFALLTSVFTLFFNFSLDLNRPFGGVYQIRRSAVASSLLQARRQLEISGGVPYGEEARAVADARPKEGAEKPKEGRWSG